VSTARNRLLASRWRHVLFLVPLGLLIGAIAGWAFRDFLFGVGVGGVLGCFFGLLLVLRSPRD